MEAGRVLVIDDSPTIRKLVEMTLAASGWTVSFAGTGREGVADAAASPPDLIVLDFVLPDMRGIDVCARLAGEGRTRGIPVVVITAKSDEVRHLFEPFPAVMACLPKPFTPDQLKKIAAAAVAGKTRSASETFPRATRDAAAQALFGKLRGAFANIPEWSREQGTTAPAAFFARKILTAERVEAILDALLPFYRATLEDAPAAPVSAAPSSDTMLQGQLSGWPLSAILSLFAATGRTGELTVSYGERSILLYWREGMILLVTSFDANEYLRGASLGKVSPAALARAKEAQKATARPAFVTLAEEGAPLTGPLGDLLHRQGRRLLLDALDATRATFAWRDLSALPLYVDAHGRHVSTTRNTLVLGAPSMDSAPAPASSLEQLALERLRRSGAATSVGEDDVFDRVRGFTAKIRRFDLDGSERRVLAALDGSESVAGVAERVSLSVSEAVAVVARLADVGLVTERVLADGIPPRPVMVLEPDVEGFLKPLEMLLKSRATGTEVVNLVAERDIVGAIRRERPRLVILSNAAAGVSIEATARAVRAEGELDDVSLVAVLEPDSVPDAASLGAAGFDAVFVKPVPYADLERLID